MNLMGGHISPGARAAELINSVFKTDVQSTIEKPKSGTETVIEKGKILEIALKKIPQGDLSEFKEKQNALAKSVLDAADRLQGFSPVHQGDPKVTDKIFEAAIKKTGTNAKEKNDLAKDLKLYANQLMQTTLHRRGELKSERKQIDEEVFTHLGAMEQQFRKHMQKQFEDLKPLNTLAPDIQRNAIDNGRVTIISSTGREIDLDTNNGLYGYVDSLLEQAMIELGMTQGKEETLNKEGASIKEKFHALVEDKIGKNKDLKNVNQDVFRNVLNTLVMDLKTSDNPNQKKLAFVLFALNQCWIVQPGTKFSQIARETYGHERFQYSAQAQLHDLTRILIVFEKNGGITLEATGGHTNKDYKEVGEDYRALFTTIARMKSGDEENLAITFDINMIVKKSKIDDADIKKFINHMLIAGFKPSITPGKV